MMAGKVVGLEFEIISRLDSYLLMTVRLKLEKIVALTCEVLRYALEMSKWKHYKTSKTILANLDVSGKGNHQSCVNLFSLLNLLRYIYF